MRRDGRFRLSLHSRLVLITTAILIVGGAVAYAAMEWNLAFAGMSSWARWMNALFMSVTCRTAGFNTVNYGDLADSTVFLTMVLMQIGGSPGSTAGGFKTTTVALLAVLSWSRIAGRQSVNCFNRTVPNDTIQRAVGLFVTVTVVVIACIFVFTLTDLAHLGHSKVAGRFLKLAFETVSAFNTVGLSMGVTPELTSTGRWMTILLMFAGRVGPLTLVAAMARRQKAGRGKDYRFAHEGVDVG